MTGAKSKLVYDVKYRGTQVNRIELDRKLEKKLPMQCIVRNSSSKNKLYDQNQN